MDIEMEINVEKPAPIDVHMHNEQVFKALFDVVIYQFHWCWSCFRRTAHLYGFMEVTETGQLVQGQICIRCGKFKKW